MSASILLMMASPGACAAYCSIDLFTVPMLCYAKMPNQGVLLKVTCLNNSAPKATVLPASVSGLRAQLPMLSARTLLLQLAVTA